MVELNNVTYNKICRLILISRVILPPSNATGNYAGRKYTRLYLYNLFILLFIQLYILYIVYIIMVTYLLCVSSQLSIHVSKLQLTKYSLIVSKASWCVFTYVPTFVFCVLNKFIDCSQSSHRDNLYWNWVLIIINGII